VQTSVAEVQTSVAEVQTSVAEVQNTQLIKLIKEKEELTAATEIWLSIPEAPTPTAADRRHLSKAMRTIGARKLAEAGHSGQPTAQQLVDAAFEEFTNLAEWCVKKGLSARSVANTATTWRFLLSETHGTTSLKPTRPQRVAGQAGGGAPAGKPDTRPSQDGASPDDAERARKAAERHRQDIAIALARKAERERRAAAATNGNGNGAPSHP
jgi:hypothetical protein